MKLRGIEFGQAFNASGARNFFGHDGWWFHHLFNRAADPLSMLGLRAALHYEGCTFVSKTTTLTERMGNMHLYRETTKPIELTPECIIVKPLAGVVLNKVALSGPGIRWLLKEGSWQATTDPFMISIMAVGKDKKERLREIQAMAEFIAEDLHNFCGEFALQVNFSCPNVGHAQVDLVDEVGATLDVLADILPKVPLVPKFNALLDTRLAMQMAEHDSLDAIVMGNTIPWGALPESIDWEGLFGSSKSPLEKMGESGTGGGGLSGRPLLPIVCQWIADAVADGFEKPIIAGGGILHERDVFLTYAAGASAIEIGSASILRPWRVQAIIDEAKRVFT